GGGVDDEEIEAVYVKVQDFEKKCKNMIRTPLLDFAYMWFLKEKRGKLKII
ncbi:NUDIX hydrolase, partial [Campylobacter sp. CH185]